MHRGHVRLPKSLFNGVKSTYRPVYSEARSATASEGSITGELRKLVDGKSFLH